MTEPVNMKTLGGLSYNENLVSSAKKLKNGKYIGIYHHSDGYPEYLGELLLTYYDTEEKLDKLISLGDISFAGPIPEDDPKLWDRHFDFSTGRPDYESDKCRTYKITPYRSKKK